MLSVSLWEIFYLTNHMSVKILNLIIRKITFSGEFTIRVGDCVERVAAKNISENERLAKVNYTVKFYRVICGKTLEY